MKDVSDFIVRFNSSLTKKRLMLPDTKVTKEILYTLKKTGFLQYKIIHDSSYKLGILGIEVISNQVRGLELISKSSREVFLSYEDLLSDPKLKGPTSFYIMTTSKLGITSSWEALQQKVGGKVLLKVW